MGRGSGGAAYSVGQPGGARSDKLLKKIIPSIEEMLSAGEIVPPPPPEDAQPPAIPEPESIGDEGHRSA